MTEEEWLACFEPGEMMDFLRAEFPDQHMRDRDTFARKCRLFACACGRRLWQWLTDVRSISAIEVAERLVDEQADANELEFARQAAKVRVDETIIIRDGTAYLNDSEAQAAEAAEGVANRNSWDAACLCRGNAEWAFQLEGLPDGWVSLTERSEEEGCPGERRQQALLIHDIFGNPFRHIALNPDWQTPTIASLAQAAYDNRTLPAGTLEHDRLAILADALEETGCDNADILNHLRDPGDHVRGCWVLDLLLGKA